MSTHLARAEMFLQQSRPAEAERESALAIAQEPQNPFAHALLALCRVDLRRAGDALEPARAAVGLAPDYAYFHYVHAYVLHHLDREAEALAGTDEALRLSPQEADTLTLRASIKLAQRDWPGALAEAEAALAVNAEHVQAANLRAMALVRLGRKAEAAETVNFALERAPEHAFSHANQGWTCLHRNDPRRAQEFFREALRLDPELEFARQGMLEALKARNPVYRAILAYYLWIGRQSRRVQWAFVIGSLVALRFVRTAVDAAPWAGWVLWPLVIGFYVFIYLSWTAGPMFNLLLRLDRFGRLVLSRDERVGSNWFGGSLALVLGGLGWWAAGGGELAMLLTIMAAVLSVCVSATWVRTGRSRRILAWSTGGLAVAAVAFGVLCFVSEDGAVTMLSLFFLGFLGFQFAANALSH